MTRVTVGAGPLQLALNTRPQNSSRLVLVVRYRAASYAP